MTKAFDGIFPIGLGTGRFPFPDPETSEADFEKAVDLVLYALNRGINYIDVGTGYSSGKAFSVLKEAFRHTDKKFNVTIKVNAYEEKHVAEDYYKEALNILAQMGLEKASHFLLWTLMDSKQFHQSIGSDSLYDAAIRLKKEGKIQHIGASVHMQHDDIMEVIDSGYFEFVLVSYHLLNFIDMQGVLDHALKKGVDILVMNPLYGGLIPQNGHLFEYAKYSPQETTVEAAVRAVLSHPAVKCVLAGAENKQQLDEYLSAVTWSAFDEQNKAERCTMIRQQITQSRTFCSYCRYCADCPQKIPVPEIMNARNIFILQDERREYAAEKNFFQLLHEKFNLDFDTSENPCVKCGKCENICTQHLDIMESINEIYRIVGKTCYDKGSRRKRFDELLHHKDYKKVGFWPTSAGTKKILEIYEELFGEIPFEVLLFDSNPDYHGKERFGYIVHNKSEAEGLGVDCILITSYQYGKIIYEQIKELEQKGTDLKVLYRENDVDWWW